MKTTLTQGEILSSDLYFHKYLGMRCIIHVTVLVLCIVAYSIVECV